MNMRKLSAILLTGAILLGANTAVSAADVPTVGQGTPEAEATVSIKKNVEYAEGITGPNATFSFTATPVTLGAPNATISDVQYTEESYKNAVLQDKKYTASQTMNIQFDKFDHAGMYEYTVKETQGQEEGFQYSTKEYKLRVFVENKPDGSGVYVKNITAETEGQKQNEVSFINTYTKNGGGNGKDALVIEKQTTGNYADKTKEFKFKLKLEKAATTQDATVVGKIGAEEIEFTYGEEKEFKLSDGKKLAFANLPAGTRYVVTEIGVEDKYVPTVTVVENGAETVKDQKGEDATDLASSTTTNLVGENENKVTFVNEYTEFGDNPITGILENNMPFILLIGVGIAAFGLVIVAKRRRISER